MWIIDLKIILDITEKNISEPRSLAVLRLDVFTELDGPSFSFCRGGVVGLALDETVQSGDFQSAEDFGFLALTSVVGGGGNGNGGGSISDGSGL